MEGAMEGIIIDLGAAADARRGAYAELMCLDSGHPSSGGSAMLAEKLLADACTQLVKVAQDLIHEADALATHRARLLREHPESFGADDGARNT